ncbi:hypothetical protein SmJEL517_g03150 [Synchytrium microbalum]|uniref:Major facilitator superfamily (MFS) profile domain-containing protein n=1 Tax=Synchytrium microbalum TaxID=1806994 RepID=A0A507BXX4_9FUNG|nr:uncharacterized protein SmJEL517_g03150 [Synchytrium microbalum]TPX34170.1 hypothetical protein SmJEL517_g03150 [Synchytrium microbalum]
MADMEKDATKELISSTDFSTSEESALRRKYVKISGWFPSFANRVVRRLDSRLIPVALLMYVFAYLDRVNIGNARAYGLNVVTGLGQMERDNGMQGSDYNLALSLFFITYTAVEPFSNLILLRVPPRYFFSRIMISWGILAACMAASSSFASMLTIRLLLGAAEAGLLPGLAFWLSQWYKPNEIALRISFFYGGSALATAFSGLLATAIFYMDGAAHLAAWRWIFILEGVPSVIIGIFVIFAIPDYPETAKFLNERERDIAISRLRYDNPEYNTRRIDFKEIVATLKQWEVWVQLGVFFSCAIPAYSIVYFQPTILTYLGYSGVAAQWMSVPTAIWPAFTIMGTSALSDRIKDRSLVIIVNHLIAATGYIIMATTFIPGLSYAMIFLLGFAHPTVSLVHGWVANNQISPMRKAFAMGFINGVGNIGGALAGQVYRSPDAPHYVIGHSINAGILLLGACFALVARLSFRSKNRTLDTSDEKTLWRYTL